MTTENDQMKMEAFRKDSMNDWPYGDESAQSQDRERLQEDIEAAWRRIYSEHIDRGLIFHEHEIADIKLLKWALGVK